MLCKCSVWMIIPAVHLYAPVEDAFKNVILTLYIYVSMRFTLYAPVEDNVFRYYYH